MKTSKRRGGKFPPLDSDKRKRCDMASIAELQKARDLALASLEDAIAVRDDLYRQAAFHLVPDPGNVRYGPPVGVKDWNHYYTERDRLDIALDEAESNVWSKRSKLASKSQDLDTHEAILERPKFEKALNNLLELNKDRYQ
jgi:hypothetical protein